jgi:hypothetical protein
MSATLSQTPWFILMWINQAPLLFLVLSVATFTAGLVCFALSVFPNTVILIICIVCTSASLLSLVAISTWILAEHWAFIQTSGERYFLDLLPNNSRQYPGKSCICRISATIAIVFKWVAMQCGRMFQILGGRLQMVFAGLSR